MSTLRIPTLRKQKKTANKEAHDRAFVELCGTRVYCGVFGSPEATEMYNRLIAEWLVNGHQLPESVRERQRARQSRVEPAESDAPTEQTDAPTADYIVVDPHALTVAEICNEYWQEAKQYYRRPDGSASPGLEDVRFAIKPLKALYGLTPAEEFGPKKLVALREWLMTADPTTARKALCRKTINGRVEIIKRIFRRAVANERIKPDVWKSLDAVEGLRKHRSKARETERCGQWRWRLSRRLEIW